MSDPDNRQGGASRGADKPTHANPLPDEGERWLRSVVENSWELVKVIEPDGTLRYASPALRRMLGYDPEEAVGKMNVFDHVHPDDLSHVLEETEKALLDEGVVSNVVEYRIRHKDGSWRHVQSVGTYLLDDPHVRGVLLTVRDVSERKEVEEALRRSEAEVYSILESISDAFFALDKEWRFSYVNPQAAVLFERKREDLIGERLWEDPTFYPHYRRAVAEGRTTSFEGYYPPLDKWYSVRAYPSESGLSVYLQDITERKRADERIRFQSGLLDAVGQAVIATDTEGKVIYWNRCAEELYGWSAEEVMGRPVEDFAVAEDLRGKLTEIMEEIRAGKSWSGEFTVLRKDGGSVPVMATDTPVFGERGDVIGFIGVSTDVSKLKEAEQQLAESERRFSAVVSNAHAFVYRCLNEPGWPNEYASDHALELTGYPPEVLLVGGGVRFGDLIVEEDRQRVWEEIQEALAERRGFEIRYAIRHKDGEIRHVLDHGQGIYGEDGGVVALEGMSYDITDLTEAEQRLKVSEVRYRTLVEQIPAITFVDRADGSEESLYVSPQVEEMLGYTPQEWKAGRLWRERLYPDDRERILASDERFEAHGDPVDLEYRLFAKDGSVVWVREETVLVRGEGGEPLYVQGIMTDVTGRKEAEEALKESEQRFRRSFEDATVGMALVATDGRWLRVNKSLCEIVGYSEGELLGKTFQDITHPADLDADLDHVRRLLAGEIRTYQIEKRYLHKDGHVVWVLLGVSLVHNGGGQPLYFISQIQDVTERRALEERLVRQAFHDSLTDLPNRHRFVDRLAHALERTRRTKGRKVAVLFMDVDTFKMVNDSLGHEVGDRVLRAVSERLKGCIRPEDTLARFGGDEFVVLLDEVGEAGEAVRVAERITEVFREPLKVDGRELFVRLSIGVALGDVRTKNPEDLLRDADTAMYRAKYEGVGHSLFELSMYRRALGRLELENDLRRAIEREEFVVHYQPIVSLETGEVWGLEALVRWDHPERGFLEPGEFVPVAEESGLVVPMGEMVLEEACRRAVEWQRDFPRTPPLAIAVNLSGRQLRRPDFHEVIERALEESGLSASSLGLDITETVYISALDADTGALDRLKATGIRISIDDFGTGYSSLSYLKRIPADILKVDKSFVRGLGVEVEDTAITQTVVDLAHVLGMEVVAEGVEIEEQETLLKEMGCDFAQGYYFSKPLPPEEAQGFLAG